MKRTVKLFVFLWLCLVTVWASADGGQVGKVYHPYVDQLETELEYRGGYQRDDGDELDGRQSHRFGLGQSFSDQWFGELYLIGSNGPDSHFKVDAYEVELKLQLTEQGEYDNDWGLLFELERNTEGSKWEYSSTLIVLNEWRQWIGTLNASLSYEWGSDIDEGFETSLSAQLKYRYRQVLEPGIEFFMGEDTLAVGPILTGVFRLEGAKKTVWDVGIIAGLGADTADVNVKVNLEYEF